MNIKKITKKQNMNSELNSCCSRQRWVTGPVDNNYCFNLEKLYVATLYGQFATCGDWHVVNPWYRTICNTCHTACSLLSQTCNELAGVKAILYETPGWSSDILLKVCLRLSHFLQVNAGTEPQFPSKPFLMHNSPIIVLLDAIYSQLPKMSSNKPQIIKYVKEYTIMWHIF
jgi:hypothetical protein